VSNIAKMVPALWTMGHMTPPLWPRNVGILITTVTPEEIARDVPRLVELKRRFDIPWVGLSIEPMIADVSGALADLGDMLRDVDWLIFGGESGPNARRCEAWWIVRGMTVGRAAGCSIFIKQMGANFYLDDRTPFPLKSPAGKDPDEWPVVPFHMLRTFEFPAALS
jgi:protein gp37